LSRRSCAKADGPRSGAPSNKFDVPRSATRGRGAMRPRIALRIRLDSVHPSRALAQRAITERQEIGKNSRRSTRFETLLFVAFAKIVTTLSPWNGAALIRHSKDNSLRGSPNSAECTGVSAEKLEAGGIRSSSQRPKAGVFLVGTVRLAKSGTDEYFVKKLKKC
jgi:hypothetical protein